MRVSGKLALCLGAALLAVGCSGDGLPSLNGVSLDAPASTAASQASPDGSSDSHPFATSGTTTPGGREVIQNPTIAEIMQTGALAEVSWGRADAPVTIIKYASLTCPYCRKFQKETFTQLKREYIDTGKVRFIIREFPIGHTSGAATIALRCAPPDKYLDLYGKFLDQQATWVSLEVRPDAIYKVASQVGMTRAQFDACYQNQGMIDGLKWVKDRGRKLGVIGTPNFFIGGRLVKRVLDMKDIRETVEPLLKTAASTADASATR